MVTEQWTRYLMVVVNMARKSGAIGTWSAMENQHEGCR